MKFLISSIVIALLIPLMMIGFGKDFMKNPPKTINKIYGYRTKMSMMNEETWKFANEHHGKLWWKAGWILLVLSSIPLLFVLGITSDSTIGLVFGSVCLVQLLVLVLSIIPTERALKKEFDEYGNRRSDIP